MHITEVRVKVVQSKNEKLRGFASITIDNEFVVRDLKIISGNKGIFVAMPSRKITDRCQKCYAKNALRASFCSNCGAKLPQNRGMKDGQGRAKLHADIAHPINSTCRDTIQQTVLDTYNEEIQRIERGESRAIEYDGEESDFIDLGPSPKPGGDAPGEGNTPAGEPGTE